MSRPITGRGSIRGRFVAAFPMDGSLAEGYEVYETDEGFTVWKDGELNPIVSPTIRRAIDLCLHNAGWGDPDAWVPRIPAVLDPDAYPAIRVANAALRDARAEWLGQAPDFPVDGVCPRCGGSSDWKIVTQGYTQYCDAEFDWENLLDERGNAVLDEHGEDQLDPAKSGLHGHTDGWDDMSDDGDWVFVTHACGEFACKLPENVVWD